MSKMRKEYDPNKVKRRKRKPIVYIICEGKETETLYFKHFRSRNCGWILCQFHQNIKRRNIW